MDTGVRQMVRTGGVVAAWLVLGVASVVGASPAAARPESAQESSRASGGSTDHTVSVERGMRIEMSGRNGCNGLVRVRTWRRDAVRVQARHGSRTSIQVTPRDRVLVIRVQSPQVPSVDFELTVPEWIGFTAGGPFCSVDLDGLSGNVAVETVEGDIDLANVTGTTTAKAIEGDIGVTGSRGRLQIMTIEGDIDVRRASGEIVAESTEGDVRLTGIQASAVEVSTVEGDVSFEGLFVASGRYAFTSHDGDVWIEIPDNSNATIAARTFSGPLLDSNLPLKAQSTSARGRRATYTIGNGSAEVAVETFDGGIVIRRTGSRAAASPSR